MKSTNIAALCLALAGASTPAWAQLPEPAKAPPSRTAVPDGAALPETSEPRRPAPAGPLPDVPSDEEIMIIVPGEEAALPAARPGVGGVSIYGLTDAAALNLLKQKLGPQLGVPVALYDGRRQFTITRAKAGATIAYRELMKAAQTSRRNVPLRFRVDPAVTARTLKSLAPRIEARHPVGATRTVVAIDESVQRIRAALEARPPRGDIDLVLKQQSVPKAPAPAPGAAAPNARFPYLLASYTTRFDPRIRGRSKNLRLSAANVNNTIVGPGKIFSANKAIGPRTGDAWKEAKMFVNSQVVSGVGAGICQCSSTLYNAALLAGFPIVERHPHTFRVTYVPASRDAAIYWGQKDMKFRNSSSGPVLVRTRVSGNRFHAELWGTAPSPNKVEVSSQVLSSKNGGTRSEAYRTITAGGTARKQRLSRDYYKPMPKSR